MWRIRKFFLHPKLQNESGDILYRLSKKSQVIFSTHAANLLSNFNSRQIRQMVQGEDGYARISEKTDISEVLDDLGYSAGDLMNVNFVFIVEGRQDKSRLPLLLKKYYSEMYDENGNLVTDQLDELTGTAAGKPASETANGRTIGKTDLYVGAIQKASAKVDQVDASMTDSNGAVILTVTNTKSFCYHRLVEEDCIW